MFSPTFLQKSDEDQKRIDLINKNFREVASELGLTSEQIKAIELSLDSKFRSINPKVQKMYSEYLNKIFATKLKLFRGFVDSNRGITYDHINRTWTLTGSGTTEISWDGVIKEITLPWTSPAHAATTDVIHYLYSSDGINYVTSTTPWTYDFIQISDAYYDSNPAYRFALKETHGATQDPEDHRQNHQARGTYRVSGGTLTAGSYQKEPASPINADNRPLFDATTISDEDKQTTNAASLTESYTRYWASSNGLRNWSLADANIVGIGTTYPLYDDNGTLTELTTNRFMWIYRIEMPVTDDAQSQQFRTFLIPGSEYFTSKASALTGAIKYRVGNFANISPEFVCVRRILIETSASYSTTGKFRIVTDELVEASRVSSTGASDAGVTGAGTQGYVTQWTGPSTIGNSPLLLIAVDVVSAANITLSGPQTVDGLSIPVGATVLAKNQTATAENGIYTVNAGAWTRHPQCDSSDEIRSAIAYCLNDGTANKKNFQFLCTNTASITIGTTAIGYAQIPFGIGTAAQQAAAGNHTHTSIATTAASSIGSSLRMRYTSRTGSATTNAADLWVVYSGAGGHTETMYDGTAVSNNSGFWIRYTNATAFSWTLAPAASNSINGSTSSIVIPAGYSVDVFNIADNAWRITGWFRNSQNVETEELLTRLVSTTAASVDILGLNAKSSGAPADGHGPRFNFYHEGSGVAKTILGYIEYYRNGANNTSAFQLYTYLAGVAKRIFNASDRLLVIDPMIRSAGMSGRRNPIAVSGAGTNVEINSDLEWQDFRFSANVTYSVKSFKTPPADGAMITASMTSALPRTASAILEFVFAGTPSTGYSKLLWGKNLSSTGSWTITGTDTYPRSGTFRYSSGDDAWILVSVGAA